MKKLKTYLIAGILVWLPIGLTIWILNTVIGFVNALLPQNISDWVFGRHIPGTGILIMLIVILLTGIIAKNIFGQKILSWSNTLFLKIPIVKSIYKGIKQVSDTLLSQNGNAFRKALLVRFPHGEAWTIAFITGNTLNLIEDHESYVNVYVPTTPNPTSGYFIIVKKSDTRELEMTVDQALRYIIAMGAVDTRSAKIIKK